MSKGQFDQTNVDKLITALYLAQSDNREKMLSDLIQNVLFQVNEPLKSDSIVKYINENFHLEPITYEVSTTLNSLVQTGELLFYEPYYSLSEKSKQRIYENILRTKDESDRRFTLFEKIVRKSFQGNLTADQLRNLWNVFNEYLLECFMQYGRKAIEIFLPYEEMSISEDEDIHRNACEKLETSELREIFKKLISEYPNNLSALELRYLLTLATRAERFYSLGVEKVEYEKLKSLEIKDLVVVLDTNILYSVLDLRYHAENAAIDELIKLAKEKSIDLRLVYIRKTYSELHRAKQFLETMISRDNYRPSHIKALLGSNKLGSFAREFYQNKLKDIDTPHPSEKITYASELLKSRSVSLYNHSFPKLDDEDTTFLNKKIADYYDFQNQFNQQPNHGFGLHKTDIKIEHDVYLREAVVELKDRYSKENELKFVCITLDKSLVYFDHYMFRKGGQRGKTIINPCFIFPSVFLKKIRPFIPIVTDDYRKAFLISLTATSYDIEDKEDTIQIQKSISYFKNLGIDDEEIIIDCIKRELFLDELSKADNDEKAEQFILSEIGKQINLLKEEKNKVKQDSVEYITAKEKENERMLIEKSKEAEEALAVKEKIEEFQKQEITNLKGQIHDKENTIGNLNSRLELLEEYQKVQEEKLKEDEKNAIFKKNLLKWETEKINFIKQQWAETTPRLKRDTIYMFKCTLLMLAPILIATAIIIFKNSLTELAKKNNFTINFNLIYIILGTLQLIELFARTYIINKERVNIGWKWFFALFLKKTYQKFFKKINSESETLFLSNNPKPVK